MLLDYSAITKEQEIKMCSYMKTSKILLHAKKQSAEHSKYSENMHQTDFGDFL